jgi:hypothetical protein
VHDFNPGEENGLFWTVPLHNGDARADFDSGTASLTLNRFEIDDYGNVANALSGGHEIATADLTVHLDWSGLGASNPVSNASLPTPFSAQERRAFNSGATMSWSAVENGAQIVGARNTADVAVLARDRNGVFF